MRFGHGAALVGAVLAVVGALFAPWMNFEQAAISATGWTVPSGQILGALALAVAIIAAVGLARQRLRAAATVNLVIAVCAVVWLFAAVISRTSWFELAPGEVVTMGGGYTLACWGVALMLLGTLWSLASEPRPDLGKPVLRVAMLWGDTLVDERELLAPGTVTLGEQADDHLVAEVSAELGLHFPLFRATERGYLMGLDRSLKGDVTMGRTGEHLSLNTFFDDAAEERDGVPFRQLDPADWGVVQLSGGIRVVFQFVEPYQERKGLRRVGWFAFDESMTASIVSSGVAQVLFILWAILAWQENPVRPVTHNLSKHLSVEADIQTHRTLEVEEHTDPVQESASKAAEGEAGTHGDPDEPVAKKTRLKRVKDERNAKTMPRPRTVLDILDRNMKRDNPIARVLKPAGQTWRERFAINTTGSADTDIGSGTHIAMSIRGHGRGGGGVGEGQLHGTGWESGNGDGGITQKVRLEKKRMRRVKHRVIPKSLALAGGHCSKNDIRRKVRRRVAAIRTCYERRLRSRPGLSGRVVVRFTIGPDGKTTGVNSTGSLKDPKVRSCINRVMRRIRFAKPESGFCVVKWPFVFDNGGD